MVEVGEFGSFENDAVLMLLWDAGSDFGELISEATSEFVANCVLDGVDGAMASTAEGAG